MIDVDRRTLNALLTNLGGEQKRGMGKKGEEVTITTSEVVAVVNATLEAIATETVSPNNN